MRIRKVSVLRSLEVRLGRSGTIVHSDDQRRGRRKPSRLVHEHPDICRVRAKVGYLLKLAGRSECTSSEQQNAGEGFQEHIVKPGLVTR